MFLRTADCSNDTFSDAGNNCRFAGTADQAIYIRPNCDAGFYFEFYSVFCNGRNNRRFNNFWIDTHLNRLENVATCKVNRRRPLERQNNLSALRGNQSIDNFIYISAGEIVSLKLIDIHIQTRFVCFNERHNNLRGRHTAHSHSDKCKYPDVNICRQCGNPQTYRHEMKKNRRDNHGKNYKKSRTYQHSHKEIPPVKILVLY